MIIETLVCYSDGRQELILKEVPDDWLSPPAESETEDSTETNE